MPSNVMRLLCDSANLTATVIDELTGVGPGYFRGSEVSLELLLAESGLPVPTQDFASVTVSLRPLTSEHEGLSFWSKTLVPPDMVPLPSDLNVALTAWEAGGPGQVNGLRIPAAAAALPAGSYRLHVEGRGTDDSVAVYLSAQFTVVNPAGVGGDDMGELVLALAGTIMGEATAAAASATAAAESAAAAEQAAADALDEIAALNAAVSATATQAEAEAGTANNRMMTPLRVAQQVAANTGLVHRTGTESIAGAKTFTTGITAQTLTSNTPVVSSTPATAANQLPNLGQIQDMLGSTFVPAATWPNISGITPAATLTDTTVDGPNFTFGAGLNLWKAKYCWRSIAATGDWQVTARILNQFPRQNGIVYGIALISSPANVVANIGWRDFNDFTIMRANATTGAQTSNLQAPTTAGGFNEWVRVKYVSATATYEVWLSNYGERWWKIGEYTVAAMFGGTGSANKADRIGIGIMTSETSGQTIAVSVPSWESNS